jgi:hypothetical protein
MARGLGALFAGLGGGLTGYAQQEQRKREEEERRQNREFSEALQLYQADLEPVEQARGRASRMSNVLEQAGQAAQAMPGLLGSGAVASALSQAGNAQVQDIERGRRVMLRGQEYVEPYSRSVAGVQEARGRAAETERLRKVGEERTEAERIAQILSGMSGIPTDLRQAVGAGLITPTAAMSEGRARQPKEEAPSLTGLRTRQTVAAAEAMRLLDAAGGDVERAIDMYSRNPSPDLTRAQIALTREDFDAAKRRQTRGSAAGGMFMPQLMRDFGMEQP